MLVLFYFTTHNFFYLTVHCCSYCNVSRLYDYDFDLSCSVEANHRNAVQLVVGFPWLSDAALTFKRLSFPTAL